MNDINLRVAEKIARIAHKPNIPPRAMFILMQRCIRISLRHRDLIRAERRVFRREARKLDAYLPFTKKQIDMLLLKSRTHREEELQRLRQGLVGFGYHLIKDTDRAFETIGFDGVCDLLSINQVHRHAAQFSEDQSLAGLIYVARLENSASPSPEAWGAGGPLFEACLATMMDWIKTAPENDLPDLFGSGSPFARVNLVSVKAETLQ